MARRPVEVKPVSRETLLLLERHLPYGPPEKHADRLARQEQGIVTYLVAWCDGEPVGHALVKWRGSDEARVAALFQTPCPEVEDLLVKENHRSRGVGTQLLCKAERLAATRGFTQIGLGVDIDNTRARRLYEWLGYRDVGLEPVRERYEWIGRDGSTAFWEEECLYLVKSLVAEQETARE